MKKYILIICTLLICSQVMGQSGMEELVQNHPDWIWPRSDAHAVISPLNAGDRWKTYIEPGGSFSPGFNSYGVSYLVYDVQTKDFFAPELLPINQIESFWEEGYLPVYNSKWSAGKLNIEIKLFTEELEGEVVTSLLIKAKNVSKDTFKGLVYITFRPYGAAGGDAFGWEYDSGAGWIKMAGQGIALNDNNMAKFSSVKSPDDITLHIKNGSLPIAQPGATSAALQHELMLVPGDSDIWHIDFIIHPSAPKPAKGLVEYLNKDINSRLETVKLYWKDKIERVQINLPDSRLRDAFYSSIAQILNTMVYGQLRITPVSYPLFWLRDSVYMMDLLEKTELGEFLEGSYDEVINNIFLSGLGPEADAPGLGLWILEERMKFRPDNDWFRDIYPAVKEKAELIIKMMTTDRELRGISPAFLPKMPQEKEFGIYCKPRKDGLIQGIMDTHMPLLWVNLWSLRGLRIASRFAETLGFKNDAKRFKEYSEELTAAVNNKIQVLFGQNDRDMACVFWPTDAFSIDTPALRDSAYHWWLKYKEYKGSLVKERNWLYFELAQAHNMLYLGYRDKVWMVIERYLNEQNFPGLYVYKEGDSGCADPTGVWSRINGWYLKPGNMPHGWISAELALLIRDLLYYEYDDQLIIGAGVPGNWIIPGNSIEVAGAPTYFGQLSYKLDVDKKGRINIDLTLERVPPNGISFNFPGIEPRVFHTNRIKVQLGEIQKPS